MSMDNRSCKDCEFWDMYKDNAYGDCHRCAPMAVDKNSIGIFPITYYDSWCGMFKKDKVKIEEVPFFESI